MDRLAEKVARQHLAGLNDIQNRIEAIPGWESKSFLRSLHEQARTRNLSMNQLAALKKIEDESKSRAQVPAPAAAHPHDVVLQRGKQYMQPAERTAIIRALADKGVVTIYDPMSAVSGNKELLAWFVKELTSGFYGMAENFAEQNADEDDPRRREYNSRMQAGAEKAAREMEHARVDVKKIGDGVTTILKMHPTYRDLEAKHGLPRR